MEPYEIFFYQLFALVPANGDTCTQLGKIKLIATLYQIKFGLNRTSPDVPQGACLHARIGLIVVGRNDTRQHMLLYTLLFWFATHLQTLRDWLVQYRRKKKQKQSSKGSSAQKNVYLTVVFNCSDQYCTRKNETEWACCCSWCCCCRGQQLCIESQFAECSGNNWGFHWYVSWCRTRSSHLWSILNNLWMESKDRALLTRSFVCYNTVANWLTCGYLQNIWLLHPKLCINNPYCKKIPVRTIALW